MSGILFFVSLATRTSAPDDDELSRPANENHISSQIHDYLVPVSPSMSAELSKYYCITVKIE